MSDPIVYPPGRCDVPFIRADDPALRDMICKNCGRELSQHIPVRTANGGDVSICATTFAADDAPKPRRMAANLEVFANKYHRAEHDEHKSCAEKPACQPVVAEPPAFGLCSRCGSPCPMCRARSQAICDHGLCENHYDDVTVTDERSYVPPISEAEETDAAIGRELLAMVRCMDRAATKAVLDATNQWTRHTTVDMHAVKNSFADALLVEAKRRVAAPSEAR